MYCIQKVQYRSTVLNSNLLRGMPRKRMGSSILKSSHLRNPRGVSKHQYCCFQPPPPPAHVIENSKFLQNAYFYVTASACFYVCILLQYFFSTFMYRFLVYISLLLLKKCLPPQTDLFVYICDGMQIHCQQ